MYLRNPSNASSRLGIASDLPVSWTLSISWLFVSKASRCTRSGPDWNAGKQAHCRKHRVQKSIDPTGKSQCFRNPGRQCRWQQTSILTDSQPTIPSRMNCLYHQSRASRCDRRRLLFSCSYSTMNVCPSTIPSCLLVTPYLHALTQLLLGKP